MKLFIFAFLQISIAHQFGAIGVILYSDPADYTDKNEDSRVFPDNVWLPPTAAQRGTVFTGDGDPLSPGFPAISK